MFETDNEPFRVILTCGHLWTEGDPPEVSVHRVVPYGADWAVESLGSWCPACTAAGKAPEGTSWAEAWAEVDRLRAAPPGGA